jgi:predicted N-acetyltransferase YhbS
MLLLSRELHVTQLERANLAGVIALFAAQRWSYAQDEQQTWRALTAPGSLTLVALAGAQVVGVAQLLSDGEIQALLSVLLVDQQHRRQGVARRLVEQARARTNGLRIEVISCADPFYEALGFRPVSAFRATLDRVADR